MPKADVRATIKIALTRPGKLYGDLPVINHLQTATPNSFIKSIKGAININPRLKMAKTIPPTIAKGKLIIMAMVERKYLTE